MSRPTRPRRDMAPSRAPKRTVNAPVDGSDGFDLNRVTWGYRDIFKRTLEELFAQGSLGPQRQEVTRRFFELLNRSDQSGFDHVLHQFLGALNPRNRWIMDLPGVFQDVVETGCALADAKLYYGIHFFETLAKGGMGSTPASLRECLHWVHHLMRIDYDLVLAFLAGYPRLARRLRPHEIERYLEAALGIRRGNRETACAFVRGELATSETYILSITQECRLQDMSLSMRALVRALTGRNCEVFDLGQLDSDDLMMRDTKMVTVEGQIFLPARFRMFESHVLNRQWYRFCGIVAAAMLADRSFPCIHGHPRFSTCADLVGRDLGRLNLFQIAEGARVLRNALRRWPGLRGMIAWALHFESVALAERAEALSLLKDALNPQPVSPAVETFCRHTAHCINCFDTAKQLDDSWVDEVLVAYPFLRTTPFPTLSFMPDFLFPIQLSSPPTEQRLSEMKDAANALSKNNRDRQKPSTSSPAHRQPNPAANADGDSTKQSIDGTAFPYDEWDFQQNDYRPGWCLVHQIPVRPKNPPTPAADWLKEANKVKSVFERLKPAMVHREKYLPEGDDINSDQLITHIVDRHRNPSPHTRFYEKPLISHRDLAVLILLDVSGSTGEPGKTAPRVLDIEKKAGILLGQGLSVLGDAFAVCGFCSNGRKLCEYLVFKDFTERWSQAAIGRVLSVTPRNSTRIGPALRHSGHLMANQPHRQRLLLLVTDGQPQDQGYDPTTRYAQHDVRMACEENARRGIHTFAISTEKNSLRDMEIMFPHHRFALMSDIRRLPVILPRLYIQMTMR